MMRPWADATDAMREANRIVAVTGVPRAIGYIQGKGWIHHNPVGGAPPGVEAELLCFALGRLPMPLSEAGLEVLVSAMRAAYYR
jgi:hypothetical protein